MTLTKAFLFRDNGIAVVLINRICFHHVVSYFHSTFADNSVPLDDQATTGDDYLPTSSNVVMGDGVTSTTVSITILHVRGLHP